MVTVSNSYIQKNSNTKILQNFLQKKKIEYLIDIIKISTHKIIQNHSIWEIQICMTYVIFSDTSESHNISAL